MFRILYTSIFPFLFLVTSCNKSFVSTHNSAERIEVSPAIGVETSIDQLIEPYEVELNKEMKKVIAINKERLTKTRPESDLGNLVADIILEKSSAYFGQQVDFSVVNSGGIRVPYLAEGEITVGNIFELMPFDNMLVVLTIDGKQTQEMLNIAATKGGWPIAGASFKIHGDLAVDIKVGGKPLDPLKTYTVAISDYLADGGDNLKMLEGAKRFETARLFRDALIEYFTEAGMKNKVITAKIEGRVVNDE